MNMGTPRQRPGQPWLSYVLPGGEYGLAVWPVKRDRAGSDERYQTNGNRSEAPTSGTVYRGPRTPGQLSRGEGVVSPWTSALSGALRWLRDASRPAQSKGDWPGSGADGRPESGFENKPEPRSAWSRSDVKGPGQTIWSRLGGFGGAGSPGVSIAPGLKSGSRQAERSDAETAHSAIGIAARRTASPASRSSRSEADSA